MNWQEIRQQPHRWLIVEAIGAYTENEKRVIPHLDVAKTFTDDWKPARECYQRVHHADKRREYYMLHTIVAQLDTGIICRVSPLFLID